MGLSSPDLKTVELLWSPVVFVVRLSVNASRVHLLLPNHRANFNLTSHKESLSKRDSNLFK